MRLAGGARWPVAITFEALCIHFPQVARAVGLCGWRALRGARVDRVSTVVHLNDRVSDRKNAELDSFG